MVLVLIIILIGMKTDIHNKDFAHRLALKERLWGTRKWLIKHQCSAAFCGKDFKKSLLLPKLIRLQDFFSLPPHVSMRSMKRKTLKNSFLSLFQLILVQILAWLQSGRMNSSDEGMPMSHPKYQLHHRRASIILL